MSGGGARVVGLLVVGLLGSTSCGDDDGASARDASGDIGRGDAGPARDTGTDASDLGNPTADANARDAGRDAEASPDASLDAGRADDGAAMDAEPEDLGAEDAAVADDAGAPDAGPIPCADPIVPALGVENVLTTGEAFVFPVFVTQAPGSTDTLWVVEKGGLVRLVRDGAILPAAFLDLRAAIGTHEGEADERGLLGLAFHPDYAENGRFFVAFTPAVGSTEPARANIVSELRRSSADPDRADTAEVARLVAIPDAAPNHNGGMLAFGPDGMLYAGIGDGGSRCDPMRSGQDLNLLQGKLLRLDPDAPAAGYAAAGNPFSPPMGLPQIWAYGLRNPWRFSFDRDSGDLYIADVGQNIWEEIDIQPAGVAGLNYGWSAFEASDTPVASGCEPDVLVGTHTPPQVANAHFSATDTLRDACSITGGYVYRGAAIPALRGLYVYGDYCSDDLGALRWCEGTVHGPQRITGLHTTGHGLASFGEDEAGELYMVDQEAGTVVRIVPL